ncbi:MAG: hypothetical protein P1V18_01445, partial [Candidatus Gracilibacteria bacterium]|nr:hypothetical protein [Candidatus Gracilibacteria bacterium]
PSMIESGVDSALEKHGLKDFKIYVNDTVIQAIDHLILPQFTGIREDISELKEDVSDLKTGLKDLRNDMNMHVASLHERVDETHRLIGSYFEDCVTKEEHKSWEQRVVALEEA